MVIPMSVFVAGSWMLESPLYHRTTSPWKREEGGMGARLDRRVGSGCNHHRPVTLWGHSDIISSAPAAVIHPPSKTHCVTPCKKHASTRPAGFGRRWLHAYCLSRDDAPPRGATDGDGSPQAARRWACPAGDGPGGGISDCQGQWGLMAEYRMPIRVYSASPFLWVGFRLLLDACVLAC
jgi:hypothetical protein